MTHKLPAFISENLVIYHSKHTQKYVILVKKSYYDISLDSHMQDRLKHLTEMGIVEHIGRSKYVLSRNLYGAVGKSGVHTRIVGLDCETNKELLLKHMREKGSEGAPLKELQQVHRWRF